jgi:hypothetical protein
MKSLTKFEVIYALRTDAHNEASLMLLHIMSMVSMATIASM